MNLHVLPAGPIQTNAYLLTDPKRGEAVLIDAPGDVWADVKPILAAEKCRLTEVWITHGHWDYTRKAPPKSCGPPGAKVRAHVDDRVMIESPDIMERFMGGRIKLEAVKVDHWVAPGERFARAGAWRSRYDTCRDIRPGNVLFYFLPAAGIGVRRRCVVQRQHRPDRFAPAEILRPSKNRFANKSTPCQT